MKKDYKAIINKVAMMKKADEARGSNGPLNNQVMRRIPDLGLDPNSISATPNGPGKWILEAQIVDMGKWLDAMHTFGGASHNIKDFMQPSGDAEYKMEGMYADDNPSDPSHYNDEFTGEQLRRRLNR